MKKEIAPEMYNYNKFPGPSFARVGDKVVAEAIELDLVVDHKHAFEQTAFGQRFSQIMLKFDYIVGDWGSEQLRLKGFYKNEKLVKSDSKIQRLEDYLLEYCNFGCAYFVLENPNPQDLPIEKEEKPKRKRNKSRTNANRKGKPERHFTVFEKEGDFSAGKANVATKNKRNHSAKQKKQGKREFVIRQK